MGDESWKLNHFPLPFWYFHGDTHARFHVFCGNTSQNVEIFGHHVYRCGNTSLTHTRLQSLFLSLWETHTYLLVLEVKSRKMRLSLVSSLINNRKHCARSTPTFSHLLLNILNNRKRHDFRSCNIAVCAITFQLQPCFPWNCAPLEQKHCPAIQNIRFQAKKQLSLLTCLYLVWRMCYFILYFPIYWYKLNMTPIYKCTQLEPCYKIKICNI